MIESILRVSGLTTRLRLRERVLKVVDNLSFELHSGKTLALVGESGSGKTMAALSLLRILPNPPALPPEGEVWFKNQNLLALSEKEMRKIRGCKIAMIFQDPMSSLNPVFTIGDQLVEVANIHLGVEADEAAALAIHALKEVGMPFPEQQMKAYPHQLSGGMKQRVMIAMALIGKPDILIADEPTTALDVTVQAQVLDLMRKLQEQTGMAILIITHDMGVVAEMADDVVVMYASQQMEKGPVIDVWKQMAHPYTQGLFASLTEDKPFHTRLPIIKGNIPTPAHIPCGCNFHPRCPYVMDVCLQGDVPAFSLSEKHQVRCWLYRT